MTEQRDNQTQILTRNQPLPQGFADSGGLIRPSIGVLVPESRNPLLQEAVIDPRTGLMAPVRRVLVGNKPEEPKILVAGTDQIPDDAIVKEKKASPETLIFFMARPWSYFDSRMKQVGMSSPIGDIENQIQQFKNTLPEISEASMTLLKSPFRTIRDSEKNKLKLTNSQVQNLFAPETAIVNCINLPFIEDENTPVSIEQYNDFLITCVDEILSASTNDDENIEIMSRLFRYLDIINLTILYKTNSTKLDCPQLLDIIAEKISWLKDKSTSVDQKRLQSLFDFLSYFQMNSSAANKIFLDIINQHHLSHPIKHELDFQLKTDNSEEASESVKIGIEIEGVPMIFFGQIPEGFNLGFDGGDTMPELRKNDDDLYFDGNYKRQLYQLWYWTKLVQMKGASVHVHVDDPEQKLYNTFVKLVGENHDDLRKRSKTVELRFNLNSYPDDYSRALKFDEPFFHQQYDLNNLIEFLIDFSVTGQIDQNILNQLPMTWKTRFRESNKLSYEELINNLSNTNFLEFESREKFESFIFNNILQLDRDLSFEEFIHILTILPSKGPYLFALIVKLNRKFSVDELTELIDNLHNKDIVINDINWFLVNYVNQELSLEDIIKIVNYMDLNTNELSTLLGKFKNKINFSEFIELADLLKWNYSVRTLVANNLSPISFEQAMIISSKYFANVKRQYKKSEVITLIFSKVDREIRKEDYEYLIESESESDTSHTIAGIINNSNVEFELNDILNYCEDGNFMYDPIIFFSMVSKIKENLNIEEVKSVMQIQISSEIELDYPLTLELFNKIEHGHTFRELIDSFKDLPDFDQVSKIIVEVCSESIEESDVLFILQIWKSLNHYDNEVYKILLKNVSGLSFEIVLQLIELIPEKYYLYDDIGNGAEILINKLDRKISIFEMIQIIDIFEKTGKIINLSVTTSLLSKLYLAKEDMNHLKELINKIKDNYEGYPNFRNEFYNIWTRFLEVELPRPLKLSEVIKYTTT